MTTIFTSKIEELPPTSDMKMIDIWLIFCLVVPFTEVVLRTAIECMSCSCQVCEPKEANAAKAEKEVTRVWVGTGAKVAPQQVANQLWLIQNWSNPSRFWARLRKRKEWQPLEQARWMRRRAWRLLEENAGKRSFCKVSVSQVRLFNHFPWLVILEKLNNVLFLFRDLDPSYNRPSCYAGLCSACPCLLQQWWLNPIFFLSVMITDHWSVLNKRPTFWEFDV